MILSMTYHCVGDKPECLKCSASKSWPFCWIQPLGYSSTLADMDLALVNAGMKRYTTDGVAVWSELCLKKYVQLCCHHLQSRESDRDHIMFC